ncbi:hypothetical protein LXA43DRAFT_1068114 [Ganoderma leucocontextum]|nr:hypothetical protein LXA43DRAFT_1068114 [Ganoderma leucocontextum]
MSETPRHHMSLTRNLGSGNKRSALDCPPNVAGEQGPPQKRVRIRPGTPDDIDGPTAIAASSSDGSGAEGLVSSQAADGIQPDFSADVVHSQGKDGAPPLAWGQNAMAAGVEPEFFSLAWRAGAESDFLTLIGGGWIRLSADLMEDPQLSDLRTTGRIQPNTAAHCHSAEEWIPPQKDQMQAWSQHLKAQMQSQRQKGPRQGATAPQPEAPDSPPVESSNRRRSPRPLLGIGDIDSTDESDHSDSGGQFAGSLDDRHAPRCPRRKAGPNDACPSLNRDDTGTPPEESASPVSTPPHSPKPEHAQAPGEPWMASNGP